MDPFQLAVIFLAAMLAGAINAIAGGGTVFSFTAMAWAGLPLVPANATNATALVPGSFGSAVAYRHHLGGLRGTLILLLIPTITGSLLGAFVVANTPESIFRRVVPFLILFATLIFASRNFLTRLARRRSGIVKTDVEAISPLGYAAGMVLQFIISFYGGYFGAGIGILMLTSLSIMGLVDIHRMNLLKTILAVFINGTAAVFFIFDGKVIWPVALVAAVGALIGGYGLARLARRINQDTLRWSVVVAGLVVSAWLYWRLR